MFSIGLSLRMLTIVPTSFCKVRPCFFDRGDDVMVAGATAQISGNGFFDLLFGGIFYPPEQAIGGHEHARRAVTTFHRVVLPESFLQGMQSLILCQSFNGNDLVPRNLNREHHT